MNMASQALFNVYSEKIGTQKVPNEALSPFVGQIVVDGAFGSSIDHSQPVNKIGEKGSVRKVLSVMARRHNSATFYNCHPITHTDRSFNLSSKVRGPNLEANRFLYEFSDSNLYCHVFIYPKEFTGVLVVDVLLDVQNGFRNVAVNSLTQKEDYSAVGTVNLLWNNSQFENILAIMCSIAGVATRDGNIVQLSEVLKRIKDASPD